MAVLTDVAVAMGPRNKRRTAKLAVAVAVLAAVVAGVVLLRSGPGGSGAAVSHGGNPASAARMWITQRLSYGLTEQQVKQRVGSPDRVAGHCWVYRENLPVHGGTLDAQRVCFLGGVYAYDFSEVNGKWVIPPSRVPAQP